MTHHSDYTMIERQQQDNNHHAIVMDDDCNEVMYVNTARSAII